MFSIFFPRSRKTQSSLNLSPPPTKQRCWWIRVSPTCDLILTNVSNNSNGHPWKVVPLSNRPSTVSTGWQRSLNVANERLKSSQETTMSREAIRAASRLIICRKTWRRVESGRQKGKFEPAQHLSGSSDSRSRLFNNHFRCRRISEIFSPLY